LANEVVDLLKESALISTLGETDLLCRANQLAAEHYLFFEPLILAALCYYVAVVALSSFVKVLEKRMRRYASH
jgi:ABC-type amino acid transport system permease subunit